MTGRYWYGQSIGLTSGFEYTSPIAIGGWPLLHIAGGFDPVTMQPRIARGIIAIGNIAVGAIAIGGVACGLFTVGGASIGLAAAIGGAPVGPGLAVGGLPPRSAAG